MTDHDPSGLNMPVDLKNRINRYSQRGDITIERIALTIAQVRQYNLAPNPTKSADTRSKAYVQQFGKQCWELDALRPDVLEELVKEHIKKYINGDLWQARLNTVLAEKSKAQKKIQDIIDKMGL